MLEIKKETIVSVTIAGDHLRLLDKLCVHADNWMTHCCEASNDKEMRDFARAILSEIRHNR